MWLAGCTLLICGLFVVFPSVNWQDFSLSPFWTWLSSIASSKISLSSYHYLWALHCQWQISENGNILPGNVSDGAHWCCLCGQTGIAVLGHSWPCVRVCLADYWTWVLLWMILLQNEFGRSLQKAGWQKGFQSKAAALGDIYSEILSLPCFCRWLVSFVFLFYSEFIEGFTGRAPSAITFKTATWSMVAVRKASGSDTVACSQGFHPSPFCFCAMKIWIWFVISPLLSTTSLLHIHPEILVVPGKASGTSHLLCGIHFFPAFFFFFFPKGKVNFSNSEEG